MSSEEIQKLLGGYATDTLTDAERRALFEAALDNQELFDAVAKEQALRDVMGDPAARLQILEALGPAQQPARNRFWQWLRRPAPLALGASTVAILVIAGLIFQQAHNALHAPVQMAQVTSPKPLPAPTTAFDVIARQPELQIRAKQFAKLQSKPRSEAPHPPIPPPQSVQMDAESAANTAAPAAAPERLTAAQATPAFVAATKRSAKIKRAADLSMSTGPEVQYTLLRKDAGGEYSPISTSVFQPGDSIRLRVTPDSPAYLYLYERDATGGWTLRASLHAEESQNYEMPADGAIESSESGAKELMLVSTRQEQTSANSPTNATDPGTRMYTLTLNYR